MTVSLNCSLVFQRYTNAAATAAIIATTGNIGNIAAPIDLPIESMEVPTVLDTLAKRDPAVVANDAIDVPAVVAIEVKDVVTFFAVVAILLAVRVAIFLNELMALVLNVLMLLPAVDSPPFKVVRELDTLFAIFAADALILAKVADLEKSDTALDTFPIVLVTFPIVVINVPKAVEAGPIASATPATSIAVCCASGLSDANCFTKLVAFCTNGVIEGSKFCPNATLKSSTAAWNVLKLLAVPSDVLA